MADGFGCVERSARVAGGTALERFLLLPKSLSILREFLGDEWPEEW